MADEVWKLCARGMSDPAQTMAQLQWLLWQAAQQRAPMPPWQAAPQPWTWPPAGLPMAWPGTPPAVPATPAQDTAAAVAEAVAAVAAKAAAAEAAVAAVTKKSGRCESRIASSGIQGGSGSIGGYSSSSSK